MYSLNTTNHAHIWCHGVPHVFMGESPHKHPTPKAPDGGTRTRIKPYGARLGYAFCMIKARALGSFLRGRVFGESRRPPSAGALWVESFKSHGSWFRRLQWVG